MNYKQIHHKLTASMQESIAVKQAVLANMLDSIATVADWLAETLRSGHKLLLFGNGGSAADAQHIAAEFVGRFEKERQAWPAIALNTDTSALTALANDYGVEAMFARQVAALGQPGDLAFAISTSGNSPNVLAAVEVAGARGLRVVGFTGEQGGQLARLCDITLCMPSSRTARIQEAYMLVLHVLCEVTEAALFEDED